MKIIIRTVNIISPKQNNAYKFMKLVFQALQFLCAVNLGFFAHKPLMLQSALKVYSLFQCVLLTVTVFSQIDIGEIKFDTVWITVCLIQYLFTVLILSLSKPDTTFCNLHAELRDIDAMLQVNLSNYIEVKIVMCIFFCLIERLLITVIYCMIYYDACKPMWFSIIFIPLYAAADISLMCYAFVFYSISCRLGKLLSGLEADDVENAQRLYKTIVDLVEKYKSAFDTLYMLLLLLNVPQIMAIIFYTLRDIQNEPFPTFIWKMALQYAQGIFVLTLTIAPALTADMITTQAEKIKTKLHDLRLQQDIHQGSNIARFIRYVEARPCRFCVWKVIPLSADLLGMVLNFCVTYLIVIIQFTNTY